MIDLFETARQVQAFCDRQGWQSYFIGGIAVQRWGEPRVTRGVDLTLQAGFGSEDRFIATLLAAGGGGIDVSLGGLPFEVKAVRVTPARHP